MVCTLGLASTPHASALGSMRLSTHVSCPLLCSPDSCITVSHSFTRELWSLCPERRLLLDRSPRCPVRGALLVTAPRNRAPCLRSVSSAALPRCGREKGGAWAAWGRGVGKRLCGGQAGCRLARQALSSKVASEGHETMCHFSILGGGCGWRRQPQDAGVSMVLEWTPDRNPGNGAREAPGAQGLRVGWPVRWVERGAMNVDGVSGSRGRWPSVTFSPASGAFSGGGRRSGREAGLLPFRETWGGAGGSH